MMERLNDPNATVIVYGTASTIGTGYARISGFKSYIEENYPNVTIVETRPSEGAGTRDGCRAWAVDMVTAYPEASAFFTFFGDGAIGTYYGLQEAGRDDIIIVGYDATAEQQQIMANDGVNCILTASIAQYPDDPRSKTEPLDEWLDNKKIDIMTDLCVVITFQDGTEEEVCLGGDLTGRKEGKAILSGTFDKILPLDTVKSITIGDLTIPVPQS